MNTRKLLQRTTDIAWSMVPRPRPDDALLGNVRLVAHRGNCGEAGSATENTVAAFRRCAELGLWGIELDLQWTADGVPVVSHDADTARVFGAPGIAIGETRFDVLRRRCPQLPSLEEVLGEFADTTHLMLEIKTDTLAARHVAVLVSMLKALEPGEDYHLLCLDASVFEQLPGFDRTAMMAIAETNTAEVVAAATRLSLTRVSGHYLLFDRRVRRALRDAGIRYGVGFIPGSSVLRREIRLGSDWLFTNRAARVQRALDLLRRSAR